MWIKRLAGFAILLAIFGTLSLLIVGFLNKPKPISQTITDDSTQSSSPTTSPPTSQNSSDPPSSVYCIGRNPCYNQAEISKHSKKGDCWGWNKDVVINVTAFSEGYHLSKSGIDIEVSSVCGKDLSSALSGHVDIDGLTRNHEPATRNNQSSRVVPYFIGYYDADKP